jgi:hypothetical protein
MDVCFGYNIIKRLERTVEDELAEAPELQKLAVVELENSPLVREENQFS